MRRVSLVVAGSIAWLLCVAIGGHWWPNTAHAPGQPSHAGDKATLRMTLTKGDRRGQPRRPDALPAKLPCPFSTNQFAPEKISIAHVTSGATVLAVARDFRGTPGVLPLGRDGKRDFAWDAPGVMPGEPRGNVLVNAHTWPDGSALGNALLRNLSAGDIVVVRGAAGERQCYKVTEELEVPAVGAPAELLERYYDWEGPPQLVVLVCSGTRLGPGNWSHRTIWFAAPFAS